MDWRQRIGSAQLTPGLLAPGLLTMDSSPRASSPRASSPGAVSYHGSSCLKPLPVSERNGSKYPTQPPHHGVSAEKLTGKLEQWETQNPKQPLQGLCSEHKIPRKHMPES